MQTYLLSIHVDFGCLFSACGFAGSHVSRRLCADECRFFVEKEGDEGGSAPVMSSPVFVTCQEFVKPCFRLSFHFFSHFFNQFRVIKSSLEAQYLLVQGPMEPQFGNIMVTYFVVSAVPAAIAIWFTGTL